MRGVIAAGTVAVLVAAGCATEREEHATPAGGPEVPGFDATDMEPRVVAALEAAREAVLAEPGSAATWGRYGVVLDAHELFAPALVAYREARRLDPADFRWAYFVARVSEFANVPEEEVVAAFAAAAELNPYYVPMLVRQADALTRLAHPEEARAVYERALARDPRFARAHRGLGQVLLALGEVEPARDHLRTAVELNPEDGASHAALARAEARAGDRAAARATQARARTLDEEHTMPDPVLGEVSRAAVTADAFVLRGRALLERRDARGALRELQVAAEVRRDDAVVEALLGGAYALLGQADRALGHYDRALELREDYPEAHVDRAGLLVRLGRLDEAIAHFERAIELAPEEATYLARLASARAQRGDLAGAVATFARADSLGDLTAADENNWGSALAQAGRPADAIGHFEEAVRLDPRFPNAHFNLGLALEELKQPEEAAEHYRRALEIDPRHRSRARLEALAGSGP